jgi:hypothetical protein
MTSGVKSSFFKNLRFTIISTFFGAFLAVATKTYEHGKFYFDLLSIFSAAAAGFIPGLLFSVLQSYDDELSVYHKQLKESQFNLQQTNNLIGSSHQVYLDSLKTIQTSYDTKIDKLEKLIHYHEEKLAESYDILDRAQSSLSHYNTIQNLLGSNLFERDLINSFLSKVANHPRYITRASVVDFYQLLILGLEKCTVWRGIHQGSIQNLGFKPLDEAGETYFEILRNNQIHDKKRIIILTQEEQEDLKRKDVMEAFWNKTGKDVPSYWISREGFYQLTHLHPSIEVHDCALHNGKVLLHYHRNYHRISDPNIAEGLIMMDFFGSKYPIWRAITHIFTQLENSSYARTIRFTQITKESIDHLPTP